MDTAIIVALIALVGTLATAMFNSPVILAWIQSKPAPSSSSPQSQPPSNSSNPQPVAPVQSLSGGDADCLAQHFADIDPSRQISIEAGATNQDYYILSEDLSKKDFIGPIGIRLTQNAKMIAGLSFVFFNDGRMFKLTSVVDSNCQPVSGYSNVDRGGDPNSLQDSDTLRIQLAQGSFSLQFIFWGPKDFRFNFDQL
jgi:hypothetical protein